MKQRWDEHVSSELSTLKNHLRQRLALRMRDAERHALHSNLLRYLRRLPCYRQRRPPAHFPHHFQVHPFHTAPPARSQRLHRRFFRREPSRIPFILILKPLAIFPFPRRIYPPQKHFPMPLNRPLNPLPPSNLPPHSNVQRPPFWTPPASSPFSVSH